MDPGVTAGMTIDVIQNRVGGGNLCGFGSNVAALSTATDIVGRVLFYVGHTSVTYRYLFLVAIGT